MCAADILDKSTYSTSVRNGADPERSTLLPKASTPPMQAPLMATGSIHSWTQNSHGWDSVDMACPAFPYGGY